MGTWDELDIDIEVELDTSKLDAFESAFAELGISTAPISDIKKELKEKVAKGAEEIANQAKSLQEQYIRNNGSIHTGRLLSSIYIFHTGDMTYTVGTTISHFYPLCIENGRGAVRPVRAKALHYITKNGQEVFSQYSSPTTPKPFVQPAYDKLKGDATSIIKKHL